MFNDFYKDKKVLITGHTGFKGSWLTSWLIKLGSRVVGISKDIPTNPSMFDELSLEKMISHYLADIRDINQIEQIIKKEKPDIIFHLAAQPIVSLSYEDPLETITSNVLGTANILHVLKELNNDILAVIITSDKSYDNVEQVWGYKEDDTLGGKDIYSGSKGAAEIIIKSYYNSFFKLKDSNVKLAIGRAGNVIGGGDWAKDRIVVDCVTAWSKASRVEIRSPEATRPWQHVLEPLSGYLTLGENLSRKSYINGEAFNFGPQAEQNQTVKQLIEDLSSFWDFRSFDKVYSITDTLPFHEASLLKLNCDKSLFYLNWRACLNYKRTINFTGKWYKAFYDGKKNMFQTTMSQIEKYEGYAGKKGLKWTE